MVLEVPEKKKNSKSFIEIEEVKNGHPKLKKRKSLN